MRLALVEQFLVERGVGLLDHLELHHESAQIVHRILRLLARGGLFGLEIVLHLSGERARLEQFGLEIVARGALATQIVGKRLLLLLHELLIVGDLLNEHGNGFLALRDLVGFAVQHVDELLSGTGLNRRISSHRSGTIRTVLIIVVIVVLVVIIGFVGRVVVHFLRDDRSKIFFRHDTRRNDNGDWSDGHRHRRSRRSSGRDGDGFHWRRRFVEFRQVAVCVVSWKIGRGGGHWMFQFAVVAVVVVFRVTLSNASKKKKKKKKKKIKFQIDFFFSSFSFFFLNILQCSNINDLDCFRLVISSAHVARHRHRHCANNQN
jgi:hypothetical protein